MDKVCCRRRTKRVVVMACVQLARLRLSVHHPQPRRRRSQVSDMSISGASVGNVARPYQRSAQTQSAVTRN